MASKRQARTDSSAYCGMTKMASLWLCQLMAWGLKGFVSCPRNTTVEARHISVCWITSKPTCRLRCMQALMCVLLNIMTRFSAAKYVYTLVGHRRSLRRWNSAFTLQAINFLRPLATATCGYLNVPGATLHPERSRELSVAKRHGTLDCQLILLAHCLCTADKPAATLCTNIRKGQPHVRRVLV